MKWLKELLLAAAVTGGCAHGAPVATLSTDTPEAAIPLKVQTGGWAILHLKARLQSGGWGVKGEESAVVDIFLQGKFHSHLVAVHQQPLNYPVLLAELKPGPVRLELKLNPALSLNKGTVLIDGAELKTNTDKTLDRIFAGTPMLTLSASRLSNDYPLAVAYEQGERLKYQVYFSNEDGGTGRFPTMLMGIYNRLLDIESAVWEEDNQLVYQGPGHQTLPFTGPRRFNRPALSVCTDNGMFCPDTGNHPVVLSPAPLPMPKDPLRERFLDENPWLVQLSNEEALREKDGMGKPKAAIDSVAKNALVGDARQYLYLDATCTSKPPQNAVVSIVRLKDGRTFKSDNTAGTVANPGNLRRNCDGGVFRTVIKLPWAIRPQDLQAVGLSNKSAGPVTGEVIRAFMLNHDYSPWPLALRTKALAGEPNSEAVVILK